MSFRHATLRAAVCALAACAPQPAPVAPAPATGVGPPAPSVDPAAHSASIARAAITRSVAAFNAHDPRALADAYAPDAVVATVGPGGLEEERGRDPLVRGHEGLFAGYPDIRMESRRLLVAGGVVVHEWVSAGTHRRTGKRVGIEAASLCEIGADGLIHLDRTYFDAVTMDVHKGERAGTARPVPELLGAAPDVVVAAGAPEVGRGAARGGAAVGALFGGGRGRDPSPLLDGVVLSEVSSPGDVAGRTAVADELGLFSGKTTPARLVAAGRYVAIETSFAGTHRPSGRLVSLHRLEVLEIDGGKIKRWRTYGSNLELLAQLGRLD